MQGDDTSVVRRSVLVLVAGLLLVSVGVAALPAVEGERNVSPETPTESTDSGWSVDVDPLPGSVRPGESSDSTVLAGSNGSVDTTNPVDASNRSTGFTRNNRAREVVAIGDRSDTNGDGVPDATENASRVNTTDSDGSEPSGPGVNADETDPAGDDTDGDELSGGLERELGTDPTAADTDGDGLPDGRELRNETASGTPLPDSDPLSKDLYVQVDHVEGVSPPDDTFYASLQREFTQMSVDNPDGTQGIDLHVREGGGINESVRFTGGNFWSLKDRLYEERLGPRAGVYHHVVLARFATDHAGYGEVGGRFSVIAAGTDTDTRRFVVVHELLHNIVGHIDAPGACEDDPKHYCEGGWLRPHITPGEGEFLPDRLAAQLEDDGFAVDEREE